MARLSYPTYYDPDSPTLGLTERNYKIFETYYDTAAAACAELDTIGAMGSVFSDGVTPDGVFNPQGHIEYHSELPENRIEYGRALMARTGGIHGPGQGQATIDLLVGLRRARGPGRAHRPRGREGLRQPRHRGRRRRGEGRRRDGQRPGPQAA